jgi:hypothetical protein
MRWQTTVAVSVLVGLGSGIVCAKEYEAYRATTSVAALTGALPPVATRLSSTSTNAKSARPAQASDPVLDLLASNPYEGQLEAYRRALDVDSDSPLLDNPYADAMVFVNPYENTVGIANPYVDALRESEMRVQANLAANPYTERLRHDTNVNLDNPYSHYR